MNESLKLLHINTLKNGLSDTGLMSYGGPAWTVDTPYTNPRSDRPVKGSVERGEEGDGLTLVHQLPHAYQSNTGRYKNIYLRLTTINSVYNFLNIFE